MDSRFWMITISAPFDKGEYRQTFYYKSGSEFCFKEFNNTLNNQKNLNQDVNILFMREVTEKEWIANITYQKSV